MAKKKSVRKLKRSSISRARSKNKKVFPVKKRTDIAWRNFVFFLIMFLVSFVFYNFSMNELFRNFFGILSIILGFLSFAFLISFIVLLLLKSDKFGSGKAKKRR